VKCVSDSQAGDGKLSVLDPPVSRCSFSLVDGIVAVGVVLAISMLLLPALRESRDIARRTSCQDNLRQIGFGFESYAVNHNREFPRIEPYQPAGIYTSRLVDSGDLDPKQQLHLIICPSSPESDAIQRGVLFLRIPSLAEVASGGRDLCSQTRSTMGGSYAVRVGRLNGKQYIWIGSPGDCRSPRLIDAPSRDNLAATSPHHGGGGQNVLYDDGHVGFVVGHYVPAWGDHFFLNNDNQPAAGSHERDAVMLPSEYTPVPMLDK
jgi:hypothetical protein